ncbi:unnamed protein product [Peniophora sp. CBMAI 1063]|nr:unnamed protein product [Peniophora sp. CBMAI 1063]
MFHEETDSKAYRQSADDAWSAFIKTRFGAGPLGRSGRAARLPQLKLELETMQKYFAVAKQHMNACTGAGCLPAEILSTIFAFAQEVWPPHNRRRMHEEDRMRVVVSYDLGWIYATHVCAAWRKAALGDPALWQTVSCLALPLPMATDMLTRSGRLPLEVYIGDGISSISDDCISNWLSWPVLRRTSLLHVDDSRVDEDDMYERWNSVLTQPMPLLEDLTVSFYLDASATILPSSIWTESHPTLKSLILTNCYLPDWNTQVLGHSITNLLLNLDFLFEEDEGLPTTTELRDMFSRLTSLKTLDLRNFWPQKENSPPEPFNFYPCLETFAFEFSMRGLFASHYSYFWSLFRVPSTTALDIVAEDDVSEDTEDHPELLDPITQVDNSRFPATALVISGLQVKLFYTDVPSLVLDPPHEHLSARHIGEGSYRSLKCKNSAVKFLVPRLPLQSLRTVVVTVPAMKRFDRPDGGWVAKLGAAHETRQLSVYYVHALALMDDLTRKDANGGFSLFPRLEALVFHHDPKTVKTGAQSSLDLVLLELLSIRLEQGLPIRSLAVDSKMETMSVWSKIGRETTVSFFGPQ